MHRGGLCTKIFYFVIAALNLLVKGVMDSVPSSVPYAPIVPQAHLARFNAPPVACKAPCHASTVVCRRATSSSLVSPGSAMTRRSVSSTGRGCFRRRSVVAS